MNVFCSHFAGGPCDSAWESYNNRCYLFIDSSTRLSSATRLCQGQEAALVSVSDEEENNFIT